MSTVVGSFVGSRNGAFVESKLGERGIRKSSVGPSGELFVAYATQYQWDSNDPEDDGPWDPGTPQYVNRDVIEIQRWDSDAGTMSDIIYTLESAGFHSNNDVNPPNLYPGQIQILGFERVGNSLFLIVYERVYAPPVFGVYLYEIRGIEISLSGSDTIQKVWQTDFEFGDNSFDRPRYLRKGTDGSGPTTRLYTLEAPIGGTDPQIAGYSLSFGESMPDDGPGTTFDDNNALTSLGYTVSAYHNDTVNGTGVRYYYTDVSGNLRCVTGTSGHVEWTQSATGFHRGNIAHSAASPLMHASSSGNNLTRLLSLQNGSIIDTGGGLTGVSSTQRFPQYWAVRQVGTSVSEYFSMTSTGVPSKPALQKRTVNYGLFDTQNWVTEIECSEQYDALTTGTRIWFPSEVPTEPSP